MKFWGYYSLLVFGVTFVASLLTFAVVRQPPESGDIVAAVLIVFTFVGLVAAALSKLVGFGHAAIPKEQRGVRAAIRSLSIPLSAALVIGIVYAIGILATTKYNHVKKILYTYYLEIPIEPGETPKRIYVSDSGQQTTRRQISDEEAYRYMWQWARIFTAVAAATSVSCAAFFLSRVNRQSPELKAMLSQGLLPAQVDDSMNL